MKMFWLIAVMFLALVVPAFAEDAVGVDGDVWVVVLGALFAISEVIALTPLKSNSIFQLIANIIKKLAGK